jgi:hypothetical protein
MFRLKCKPSSGVSVYNNTKCKLLQYFRSFGRYNRWRTYKDLLYKNITIKIYKTIILTVVLNGCENVYVTFKEKHRRKVCVKSVARRIFGQRGMKRGTLERKLVMTSFITCALHEIKLE